MTYKTIEEYLNEEFRKPIKYYLKDTPKNTQCEVMQIVDYLCDNFRRLNGTAKYAEEHCAVDFVEWEEYMNEKGYLEPCDYDALEDVISEEEMKVMLGEENA